MSAGVEADLVVIGGGPAGLSAAIKASERGLSVFLIDENESLGGKLRGQLHEELTGEWWIGWDQSNELTSKAIAAGVQIMTETVAWSIEPGWTVRLSSSRGGNQDVSTIASKAVVVATGSVERPMPVSGWTLPGVFTIGGAQILTNTHRVRPGKRTVVVGVDPLSITIGRGMLLGGVDVDSIVLPPEGVPHSSPVETLKRLGSLSKLAPYFYLRFGGKLMKFPGFAAVVALFLPRSIPLWKIPLKLSTRLVGILGDDYVTGAEVERVRPNGNPVPGSRRIIKTDSVCLSNGLSPLNDLTAALGVESVNDPSVGGWVPLHSATGATAREGLFVAGNTVGVESAKISLKQGEIVAGEVANFLGRTPYLERESDLQELRMMRKHSDFTFEPHIQAGHDHIERLFTDSVNSKVSPN